MTPQSREEVRAALPALALGALDASERGAVLVSLAAYPDLMAEARQMGSVSSALLGALPPAPPRPALKASVMAAAMAARAPVARPVQAAPRPVPIAQPAASLSRRIADWLNARIALPRYATAAFAALAIVIAGAALAGNQNTAARLAQIEAASRADQTRLAQLAKERDSAVAQAQTQQRIIAALSAPDAQAVNLTGQGGATARVAYRPGATEAVFQARGLPALPTNQTYQLWLFDASGKPLPNITFADANAGLPIAAAQEFARFINFAISIEPAGGSAAPTGPIVLIAKG